MSGNHPSTCGPYCAIQHCACGQPAAHGSKRCSRCSERGWSTTGLALLFAVTVLVTLWLSPYRADAATAQPTSTGAAAFCTWFPGGTCPDWTTYSAGIALGVTS